MSLKNDKILTLEDLKKRVCHLILAIAPKASHGLGSDVSDTLIQKFRLSTIAPADEEVTSDFIPDS